MKKIKNPSKNNFKHLLVFVGIVFVSISSSAQNNIVNEVIVIDSAGLTDNFEHILFNN